MPNILSNFSSIVKNPHFYVVIILAIVIFVISFLIDSRRDPEKSNVTIGALIIDPKKFNWKRILYMLLYVYYGYHFPYFFVEFLIIAIVWKFAQQRLCLDSFLQAVKCDNWFAMRDKLFCKAINYTGDCQNAHNWFDVVFNMIAFLAGAAIFRMVRK